MQFSTLLMNWQSDVLYNRKKDGHCRLPNMAKKGNACAHPSFYHRHGRIDTETRKAHHNSIIFYAFPFVFLAPLLGSTGKKKKEILDKDKGEERKRGGEGRGG